MSLASRAVALLQKQYEVVFHRMRQSQWSAEFGPFVTMVQSPLRIWHRAGRVSAAMPIQELEPRMLLSAVTENNSEFLVVADPIAAINVAESTSTRTLSISSSFSSAATSVSAAPNENAILSTLSATTTINPVALGPIAANARSAFSGNLAHFTDSDSLATLTDYSATINWGDGQSSSGTITVDTNGGYFVSGTHTYQNEGTYTPVITIANSRIAGANLVSNGDLETGTLSGWNCYDDVSIVNNPVHAGGYALGLNASHSYDGYASQSLVVPSTGTPTLSFDYLASKGSSGWGYGGHDIYAYVYSDYDYFYIPIISSDQATNGWQHVSIDLSAYKGMSISFEMSAYGDDAMFIDNASMLGASDNSATISTTANVGPIAFIVTGQDIALYVGETKTYQVATFTNAALNSPGDFAASIAWGDGQTSTGIISDLGDGVYSVTGSHAYTSVGNFIATITVADLTGTTATGTSINLAVPYPVALWQGGSSGNWNDAANWSSGKVPDQYCDVVINNSIGSITIYNSGNVSVHGLTVETTLVLNGGGTLNVKGEMIQHATVQVNQGTLALSGGLNLTSELTIGNGARLNILGSQTLRGSGVITLQNGYVYTGSDVNSNTAEIVICDGLTIHGYGEIVNTGNTLANNGTILADVAGQSLNLGVHISNFGILAANAGTLYLGANNTSWSNSGILRAINGGVVELDSAWNNTGVLEGASGTLRLRGTLNNRDRELILNETTGALTLYGGTILGGTITGIAGTDWIIGSGNYSTLDGVTLNVDVGNTPLRILNGLVLNGTLHASSVDFIGSQEISGTGQIVLTGGSISLSNVDGTLTIASGVTIHGYGQLISGGYGTAQLINYGTILADQSEKQLTIYSFNISNHGIIGAIDAGSLNIIGYSNATICSTLFNSIGAVLSANGGSLSIISTNWSNVGEFNVGINGILNLGGSFSTAGIGNISHNEGTIRLTGILDNTNSTLVLNETTGAWQLAGGTIRNGTIAGTSGTNWLTVVAAASSLDGVILDADMYVDNATLRVIHGLELRSVITVNGPQIYFRGTQGLTGTGQIILVRAQICIAENDDYSGAVLTIGDGITIHGYGEFVENNGKLVNQGKIYADVGSQYLSFNVSFINEGTLQANVGGLYLGNNNKSWTNNGILRSINGGVIDLDSTWSNTGSLEGAGGTLTLRGTLDNRGHELILNETTGVLSLYGGTILGGTISGVAGVNWIVGGGTFSTLDGVTLNVDVGNTSLRILNGLVLNGTLYASWVNFVGNQEISGSGQIILAGGTINIANAYNILTIDDGITIRGYGSLGGGGDGRVLVNYGVILSDQDNHALYFSQVKVINSGEIRTLGNAEIYVYAAVSNDFINNADGKIETNTGKWTFNAINLENNGTIIISSGMFKLQNSNCKNDGVINIGSNGKWDMGSGSIATVSGSGSIFCAQTGQVITENKLIRGVSGGISGTEIAMYLDGFGVFRENKCGIEVSKDGIHFVVVDSIDSTKGWDVVGDLDRNTLYTVRITCRTASGCKFIYQLGTESTLDMDDVAGWYRVAGLVSRNTGIVYTSWDDTDNNGINWSSVDATYTFGSRAAVVFTQLQGITHGWYFPASENESISATQDRVFSALATYSLSALDGDSSSDPVLYVGEGNHLNGEVLVYETPEWLAAQGTSPPMEYDDSLDIIYEEIGWREGEETDDPIRYADGAVDYTETDLVSVAYGNSFGVTRSWTNQPIWASGQSLGSGMIDTGLGYIAQINGDTSIAFITSGTNVVTFNLVGGYYVPNSYTADTLVHQDGLFIITDANGTQTRYYDFSSTTPSGRAGCFISRTDSAGNRAFVVAWNDAGQMAEIDRAGADGIVGERWFYSYLSDTEANSGLLCSVQWFKANESDGWSVVREARYTYYNNNDSNGSLGDLKTVTVLDSNTNVLDTTYYRYYTFGETGGYSHAIKYIFGTDSFSHLKRVFDNPFDVSDAQISSYADHYFEYDKQHRVTRHDVQGFGGSDTQGIASYAYQYITSNNPDGANSWRYKTIEKFADGSETIVYCNSFGQAILKIDQTADSLGGSNAANNRWMTFYKYDSLGHQLWEAESSAILGYDENYADLLHWSDRTNDGIDNANYEFLSDYSGLINVTNWYTSTTASDTLAGGVVGYEQSHGVRHGELGATILTDSNDYYQHTVGIDSITQIAHSTVYRNSDGTGAITTSYNYEWYTNSLQLKQVVTTLPIVTAAQNGSGVAASSAVYYDASGRPIWTKDADGHVSYTVYDQVTGAQLKTIQDVKYANLTTAERASFDLTGWAHTIGANRVTQYEVDALGRTIKTTEPNGNISYTVYDDVNHETRTYQGWNSITHKPIGAITLTRQDEAGNYIETLSYTWDDSSGVPVDSQGRPTGTESINDARAILQSLSRMYTNDAGQVIETRSYFNLSGLTYSTAADLGLLNTNYYATYSAYDENGNLARSQDATGTITISIYDSQGRISAEYVGTNDATTDGKLWRVTNAATDSNMRLTTSYEYDHGGVGDGNVTSTTTYVDSDPNHNQVTVNLYDWRNRQIATKSGVQAVEDTSTNRPLTVQELNNLGEVLSESVYDADGLSLADVDANGIPDALSASTLRAKSLYSYDNLGRAYRSETLSVNQTTGATSSTGIVTQNWYDQRGNQIKQQSSSGLVTKYTYDGLGRLAIQYSSDGGGDVTWTDASDVLGDTVLSQDQYIYDANGNMIEIIHKDRFHNATGTGALGDTTSGILARVSYALSYYDSLNRRIASVNVGTNGGVANASGGGLDLTTDTNSDGVVDVLQGAVPTRSDTVLVSSIIYNASGQVDTTTDAKGIVTKHIYDNLGRQIAVIAAFTDGVPTNSTNNTILYTYDGAGHTTSMTALAPEGQNSQTTQYVYGVSPATGSTIASNNVLAYVMYPDEATGAASTAVDDQVHYTYNAVGQVLTATDQNGTVHTYTYDILGRRTSDTVTTLAAGIDGSVRRIDTAYDIQGNAALITSYGDVAGTQIVSQIKREYNGLGQLTAEYQAVSGAVNTATTPKVQYAYSDVATGSRLISTTYPNGRVVYYNYNVGIDGSIGRLSSISDSTGVLESYSYLGASTTVIVSHPETGITLTYVQQSGDTHANTDGGDIYTGLDRFGRVIDQNWVNSNGTTADRYQYIFDRNNNVTAKNNLTNSSLSEAYTYDDLNRLTSTTRNGTAYQNWDLDSVGNSDITTNGVTEDRDFNSQNQIVGISYDANGNTLTDKAGNQYVYDAWNHLIQVKNSSGNVLKSYTYDSLGRRITETTGSGATANTTTLYYNANWQVVEERSVDVGTGVPITTTYVWSATYIDAMVCRDQTVTSESGSTTQRIYAIHDANFNVTAIADASGQILERYAYDAYGKFTILNPIGTTKAVQTTTAGWNYLHQGGRYDADMGLYNFRNRDYNPETQRWMQQDPLGYVDGLNLYQYVKSNSVNGRDPKGTDRYINDILGGFGHVGIAVDTWEFRRDKCGHGKWHRTGAVTFNFSMDYKSTAWLGIWFGLVPVAGLVDEVPGICLNGTIEVLFSQPWQDRELLNFARMQIGGAAVPYSLIGDSCWHWSRLMMRVGYELSAPPGMSDVVRDNQVYIDSFLYK